jgi:hypothetical protein
MITHNISKEIEKYGKETICYTLNGKNCSNNNISLVITKANELCELDGGIELLRTKSKKLPTSFKLHNKKINFDIIYATPDTKELGIIASKKYKSALIMIY